MTWGTFSVDIELGNPSGTGYQTVSALVDTGASHTAIPASMLSELEIIPHTRGVFRLADGRSLELDIGQTWVRLDGIAQMTLVVFANEDTSPVLGAVTLEEFRLGVDPVSQRLIPVEGLLMSGHRID